MAGPGGHRSGGGGPAGAGLAESGKLRVHLQATLDLAETAKAHELLESGSVTGKIALTL
jgi:NADPH:quinone reductase